MAGLSSSARGQHSRRSRTPNSATPSFTAGAAGVYVAQLIVNDGFAGFRARHDCHRHANVPPVANAGLDRIVSVGSTVILDGTASSDADSDPLAYSWSLTSRPPGSTATLMSRPKFHQAS